MKRGSLAFEGGGWVVVVDVGREQQANNKHTAFVPLDLFSVYLSVQLQCQLCCLCASFSSLHHSGHFVPVC